MTLHILPNGIRSTNYSPALVNISRAVPGMRWDAANRVWAGSADAIAIVCEALTVHGIQYQGAKPTPAEEGVKVYHMDERLRSYQREAVHYLLQRRRALLADDMGLGKTCSALSAARVVGAKTLVVCPSYVRGVWANGEIAKWWPNTKVFCPQGIKKTRDIPADTDIVVIHYDILSAWRKVLADWNSAVVILDECHALMNEGSVRSKAAKEVSARASYVWGLSGTPLTNRPRDLHNVVDTICPGRFGKFFDFGLRYCDAHKESVTPTKTVWKFDGASRLEELNARLKFFMLRRLKHQVALQLPPKTRQVVRLDVAANGAWAASTNRAEMRAHLNAAADKKLPEALEMIQQHAKEGHRVVVFAYRRAVAEMAVSDSREAGIPCELVHGGVPTLRRGAAIENAKSAAGGHILAATIDSSATGIDLSYADVAVFLELTWEPHELLQAEARLHRFGQVKNVLIQYMIAQGTADELVADTVLRKLDVFESAVGPTGEALQESFAESEEDILSEMVAMIEKDKSA